ncbi:hypothetical protein DSL72_002056 [Monilinia vaccinii-corymbosi]|uniref:Uncharacterized protein n=1 Tax=Monilinia vaccinii-corymbosi TaxID=61207 RepID=A0A8A3PBJ9_9HELO|nr:hypothetical protein DSL72_002056 [Monilinia vaccinii-corymbosi]
MEYTPDPGAEAVEVPVASVSGDQGHLDAKFSGFRRWKLVPKLGSSES